MEQTASARALSWLMEELCRHFSQSVSSMMDAEHSVHWRAHSPSDDFSDDFLGVLSRFSLGSEAMIWTGSPETVSRSLGESSLRAAGIEQPVLEDVKSTYFEIVNQTVSGFSNSVSQLIGTQVSVVESRHESNPPGTPLYILELSVPEGSNGMALVVCPFPEILHELAAHFEMEPPRTMDPEIGGTTGATPAEASQYELLLDVELPVAVSFGRAQIPLKEVLKLATGSIVELNRTVTDPVEVIVNNCVIARGEVVVVGGNYGVRVRQIISRSERLRTLY